MGLEKELASLKTRRRSVRPDVMHALLSEAGFERRFGKGDQAGFHTLLPYGVAAAKDGIVYAGVQDNGEVRIAPNGRQTEVFGGDGVFTRQLIGESEAHVGPWTGSAQETRTIERA